MVDIVASKQFKIVNFSLDHYYRFNQLKNSVEFKLKGIGDFYTVGSGIIFWFDTVEQFYELAALLKNISNDPFLIQSQDIEFEVDDSGYEQYLYETIHQISLLLGEPSNPFKFFKVKNIDHIFEKKHYPYKIHYCI